MDIMRISQACASPWGKELLRDINLQIAAGEILAIIGPNGAGKTSLLNVMSGSTPLASGEIRLKDKHLHEWDRLGRARAVAVLPQQSSLSFPYSVEEVILLGRTPHGSGATNDRDLLADVMHATDTAALRHRLYTELSGGEKQRVQLARVFAQVWRPADSDIRLLLLDEPTSALDLAHQQLVMDQLHRLAEQGCAIVMVLHDFNLAASIADQVLALQDGHPACLGKPQDVMTKTLFKRVFGVDVDIISHPASGKPLVIHA